MNELLVRVNDKLTAVPEALARTFMIPKRVGGTEDKYYKQEQWYDELKQRWGE